MVCVQNVRYLVPGRVEEAEVLWSGGRKKRCYYPLCVSFIMHEALLTNIKCFALYSAFYMRQMPVRGTEGPYFRDWLENLYNNYFWFRKGLTYSENNRKTKFLLKCKCPLINKRSNN